MKTDFNFRKMMEKHSLRQIDIAKAAGLSPVTVNNFFHGKSYPSLKSVLAISNKLDVPIQDFFTTENGPCDKLIAEESPSKKYMMCPRCGYPIEVKLSLPKMKGKE